MPADPLSRVFSALADPTRRDMVARLTVADATVNELAEPYDVTVQAVPQPLRVLDAAGPVRPSRGAPRPPGADVRGGGTGFPPEAGRAGGGAAHARAGAWRADR